jgi:pyrophosphate--fructose-6-phosphate 1-phosphotransferase
MSDASKMTSLAGKHVNVAMMTAGGLAPCLSASIAQLVKYWVEAQKEGKIAGLELRFYNGGYKGLLTGDSFVLPESEWDTCDALNFFGGSPIGNSRVKVRAVLCCFLPIFLYIFNRKELLTSDGNIFIL